MLLLRPNQIHKKVTLHNSDLDGPLNIKCLKAEVYSEPVKDFR